MSEVSGANLEPRIEASMAHTLIHELNFTKKLLVAAAAFSAVAGPIILGIAGAPLLRAQSPAPLVFEVASVKLRIPTGGIFIRKLLHDVPFRISGSHVSASRRTVTELICDAYDVNEFEISGAPSWASQNGDRYDIEANAIGETAPAMAQVRLMFQSLLADRFQLKLHRDSKQLPGYHLVIGKRGSKLKPVPPDAPPSKRQGSIDQLVSELSRVLNRPVIDKTGLSGVFEYTMDWLRLDQVRRVDPDGLETAELSSLVEESLGLKLESAKDQVTILAIDHVEKPSEN
jgi:uncharacterized protein (TIGR03435 family)